MTPKPALTLTAYLQSTKAPWTALLMVNQGQRAESLVRPPTGFMLKVIKGAKCQTTAGLLTECARALDFPDYFGHNWDALEECLADLEWLPAKGYILLITDAARLLPDNEEEYETFLEVLRDAGEAWGSGQAGIGARRATPFHVLFALSEREKAKRDHWGMEKINAEPIRKSVILRRTLSKRT
ncbi:MAG: barstar family protein [Nitrospiraceae bacterium]|nr:barstar family protein [Nitrospiraceae bacterium]